MSAHSPKIARTALRAGGCGEGGGDVRTVHMEIPTDVLRDAGAAIPPEWADLDSIEVELNYVAELNWADDVPYFEGTVDGTWKDDFDANKLPDDLLEKAREKWRASR